MKKILLIILALTSIAFAQEMQGQEKILNKYFLMLDKHKNVYLKNLTGSIDSSQLMEIAKEIYAVYKKMPKITYERMWAYYDVNNKNRDTVDYPGIEYMLQKEIEKRFGKEYFYVLHFPFTFDIKVLNIELVEYFWDYKKYKTVITAQIEYVLCGEKFKMGDIIEFYCSPDQIGNFKKNKNYLVYLQYSYTQDWKFNGLFLYKNGYEIVNGLIIDKELERQNKPDIKIDDLRRQYKSIINKLEGE